MMPVGADMPGILLPEEGLDVVRSGNWKRGCLEAEVVSVGAGGEAVRSDIVLEVWGLYRLVEF